MLLGIAGVVAVLSIGAVVFAMKGHSSTPAVNLSSFDAGSAPTVVNLTGTDAAAALVADTTVTDASLPGLDPVGPGGNTGPGPVPHGGGGSAHHDGGAPKPPITPPAHAVAAARRLLRVPIPSSA